ncbi:MAG: hypothetical protein RBG13Loki_1946 [Promethearchaeota archaeon CR_4]|nr:MAG: hypothetical protein RBG13Loki_1946 [Candidatus Lokiarchaeota archaeon CR_4]
MSIIIPIFQNPPPWETFTGPPKQKILTACNAPCVHIGGAINFGNIASRLWFEVKFYDEDIISFLL